ncbi:MAG: universal stress protein [Peptococcaceae bacterium]|nr:universal stress protein [Peptococcaceae bacterium]
MAFNILLAADGSNPSFRAAEKVLELLRMNPEINVTVITVYPGGEAAADNDFSFVMNENIKDAIDEQLRKTTDKYREFFKAAGFDVDVQHRYGDPAERVCRFAENRNYDLVVVGTRGLKGFEGLVLGSVAHKIIHRCKMPVMLVR